MRMGRTFAHNGNGFLELDRLDSARIESPQVPSGMTGGVENEAMNYCVSLPYFLD